MEMEEREVPTFLLLARFLFDDRVVFGDRLGLRYCMRVIRLTGSSLNYDTNLPPCIGEFYWYC